MAMNRSWGAQWNTHVNLNTTNYEPFTYKGNLLTLNLSNMKGNNKLEPVLLKLQFYNIPLT